jgi:two-component system chemotaxis response regulator CheY
MTTLLEEPQVMIVDDMLASRALVRDMLAEMGITRVSEASDGQEALIELQRQGAQLIICDLMMDEMHGASLLSQLKRHAALHNIPFIMMSSCSESPIVKAALKMGAKDFLVKPLAFKTFRDTVMSVLYGRTPIPEW